MISQKADRYTIKNLWLASTVSQCLSCSLGSLMLMMKLTLNAGGKQVGADSVQLDDAHIQYNI